jgi:hypothetical protein
MKFQSPGKALRRGLAIVSAPDPTSLAARRADQVHGNNLSTAAAQCK